MRTLCMQPLAPSRVGGQGMQNELLLCHAVCQLVLTDVIRQSFHAEDGSCLIAPPMPTPGGPGKDRVVLCVLKKHRWAAPESVWLWWPPHAQNVWQEVLRCVSRWELLQQIASGGPTDAHLFAAPAEPAPSAAKRRPFFSMRRDAGVAHWHLSFPEPPCQCQRAALPA